MCNPQLHHPLVLGLGDFLRLFEGRLAIARGSAGPGPSFSRAPCEKVRMPPTGYRCRAPMLVAMVTSSHDRPERQSRPPLMVLGMTLDADTAFFRSGKMLGLLDGDGAHEHGCPFS